MEIQMLSNRPYLIRAFYDWIVDSECTPYIAVNAEEKQVVVPEKFIENGKIILNISPRATHDFQIDASQINFQARFSGVTRDISVPIIAVLAIYAVENGQGIVFNETDERLGKKDNPAMNYTVSTGHHVASPSMPAKKTKKTQKKKPPHLHIVK